MPTRHDCPSCQRTIAKEDRRRRKPLIPTAGVRLVERDKEAPRLVCVCGKVVILLRASL